MSQLKDLPSELQTEIFTFLSVKHLEKILSLSKSIHNQLEESETFWQELSLNYAKIVAPDMIDQIKQMVTDQNTTISRHAKYSQTFKLLIEMKKQYIAMLRLHLEVSKRRQQEVLRLELELARYAKFSKLPASNNTEQEGAPSQYQKEMEELENKLKAMIFE